jgi:DNA-binding transcriptional LysR family regulator
VIHSYLRKPNESQWTDITQLIYGPSSKTVANTQAGERTVLDRLTLRQLRLLVALDDQRKLQEAARKLHMSQSSASKMLADIERIAGVRLLERLPRGVEPTDYGEILIRRSRSVLADLRHAAQEIAGRKAGDIGAVSIGCVATPSIALVARAIAALGAKLDTIEFSLDVGTSPVLVERLVALEFDFAIARIPDEVDPRIFDYCGLDDEEGCFVVRIEHPLANCGVVALHDLVNLQWVLEPRGSVIRQSVERLFRTSGIAPPQRVINCTSHLASLAIAAETDAIVPIAVPIVEHIGDSKRLKKLRVRERLLLESYGLIRVKNRLLSPAAEIVFEIIKRVHEESSKPLPT